MFFKFFPRFLTFFDVLFIFIWTFIISMEFTVVVRAVRYGGSYCLYTLSSMLDSSTDELIHVGWRSTLTDEVETFTVSSVGFLTHQQLWQSHHAALQTTHTAIWW